MKKEKITADKLIKMFKPIPEKNWMTEVYTNGIDKCCTLGHYMRSLSEDQEDYSLECANDRDGHDLRDWSINLISEIHFVYNDIIDVNDGLCPDIYPQSTPKKRVMAFLEDAKKAGY